MSDEHRDEMNQAGGAQPQAATLSFPRRLLTEAEAAQYIGRPVKGIQALRYKGLIQYHRIDRRVHYDIRDLDAFIEENKVREWSHDSS